MKTISIKDIEGIRIGNAQNFTGGTGCTVILSETGMLPLNPFMQFFSEVEVLLDWMLLEALCSFLKKRESDLTLVLPKSHWYVSQIFLI